MLYAELNKHHNIYYLLDSLDAWNLNDQLAFIVFE